ncbi:MAG: molybdopterin cofactor-binding domain-containing protein, partial [Terriglobia bacterium]
MDKEPNIVIEPERYEFTAAPGHHFDLDRRQFFRIMGGGVAIFLLLEDVASAQNGEPGGGRGFGFGREPLPQNIGAWLHIGETGDVTVYTGKAEMGQNIRTSLTQAVAEELRAPAASVNLVMADTKLTPFDMGTFGSRTTPQMGTQLRRVASVARDSMIEMAAKRWNVPASGLTASGGAVRDPANGHVLEYADLAKGQTLAKTVMENDPLEPPADWTVAGTSLPKINGVDFVTGRHQYTPDVKRPGMLYGKVLRPVAFGATLISLDASAARTMPGVTVVRDGNFVGVAAPSEEIAQKAVVSMRAQWKSTAQISDKELFGNLKETADKQRGGERGNYERGGRAMGAVDLALGSAAHRLSQTYTVAYIAHAPLETRAAVAEWKDGKVTVWTGTQRPFAVRDEVVQAFRLAKDDVRVIVPDTGGAFGGKHTGEAAVEAVRLARAAGKPVHLQWTREEEFTWAYFRPAGVIDIKSGVESDGTLTAWEFHNYNSGGAGIGTPYNVSNQRVEFHPCDPPLRQGSYRCLAATANHFARESHMDDLARTVNMDPLEFRRKNLKDARLLAALNAASKAFGWGESKPAAGRGFGIACGTEKGGYLANCAEVAVDRVAGRVKVVRVVTAFECGAIVNPDGLKNLVTGATIMGLGGALFEAIKFDNGRIL